jgi:hypothetical protein
MQVNRGHPKRDAQIASESGASPVLISVGIQFESLGVPRADLFRITADLFRGKVRSGKDANSKAYEIQPTDLCRAR